MVCAVPARGFKVVGAFCSLRPPTLTLSLVNGYFYNGFYIRCGKSIH